LASLSHLSTGNPNRLRLIPIACALTSRLSLPPIASATAIRPQSIILAIAGAAFPMMSKWNGYTGLPGQLGAFAARSKGFGALEKRPNRATDYGACLCASVLQDFAGTGRRRWSPIQRPVSSRGWRQLARTTFSVAILAVARHVLMTVAVAVPGATAHATIRLIGPCRSDEDQLQRADGDDPAALAKSFTAIWTTNETSPGTGR
jgi:hypothetical protein